MDKEQQAKLLSEIMQDDEKDGLYDTAISKKETVQTAVNWIEDNLKNVKEGYQYMVLGGEEYVNIKHLKGIIEQAKQMEKEQIIETFDNGVYVGTYAVDKDGEQYYNETYGGQGSPDTSPNTQNK